MKSLKCVLAILAVATVLFVTPSAFAQQDDKAAEHAVALARSGNWSTFLGKGIGIGLTILGGGYGISLIASKSVESMARQPEVAGNVQGAMVIAAAMIEGAVFFALLICWFGMS